MNIFTALYLTVYLNNFVNCRDFYVGMFKKNDFLVAQDRLYKEKVSHRTVYAKYGRVFKCPITYFRVVDRLGMGRGPRVEIIRGGLREKFVVLRLTSPYNLPISVNIYVGCENKNADKIIKPSDRGNGKQTTVNPNGSVNKTQGVGKTTMEDNQNGENATKTSSATNVGGNTADGTQADGGATATEVQTEAIA